MIMNAQFEGKRTNDKLIRTKVFSQSLDQIWERCTTAEGIKSWLGDPINFSLHPGGPFYLKPASEVNQLNTEDCTILTVLPKRLISFSLSVPERFEEARKSGLKTWAILEFEPVSWNETRIVLTHLGWPSDSSWKTVQESYSAVWDIALKRLAAFDEKISEKSKAAAVGIGGVFFKCEDPKKLKEWYHNYLGLETNEYGATFEWLLADGSGRKGMTQWSLFSSSTKYFAPSVKDYMINYRVENIEHLIENLKGKGIQFTDELEVYEYGKFIHLLDPEGNKIELWESPD